MQKLFIINRKTKALEEEKIYGRVFIEALYGKNSFSSMLYGLLQKSGFTRWKIAPFIKTFGVDTSEFQEEAKSFRSFNDFFIRKLKPSSRPIAPGKDRLVLPADGRYLVFENIEETHGFFVKGKKFCLTTLLQNPEWIKRYQAGSLVMARLCPTDYHRFHFPCEAIPEKPLLINGHLYSVNPIALRKNIDILSENKRVITLLKTENFGDILYIEVGATHVGSIIQTFTPFESYRKGDEKGYFSFGGSCLLLLFEKGKVIFDTDLLEASHENMETKALMGESLGKMAHRAN